MNKKVVIILILSLLLINGCNKKEEVKEEIVEGDSVVEEVKKLQIFDEDSDTRPIAVQINNHSQARLHHAGLNDAYLVYEFIVEGGITRMMALFKDKDTAKIGSVRSARPYFLDYVLENDAIYVHYGYSDKARNEIASLGINNINGLYDNAFWRDTSLGVDYEHTAFTNMEKINSLIERKGYRTTTDSSSVLKYSVDEINIEDKKEEVIDEETKTVVTNKAYVLNIPYSYYMTVRYEYNEDEKMYYRFTNNNQHIDSITKEQYKFKNIIIAKIENYTTNEGQGRQALKNIGKGNGYFITNGHIREITWEKESRQAKTIYRYLDGNEIIVNDGNTFIQVVPINSNVSYS